MKGRKVNMFTAVDLEFPKTSLGSVSTSKTLSMLLQKSE